MDQNFLDTSIYVLSRNWRWILPAFSKPYWSHHRNFLQCVDRSLLSLVTISSTAHVPLLQWLHVNNNEVSITSFIYQSPESTYARLNYGLNDAQWSFCCIYVSGPVVRSLVLTYCYYVFFTKLPLPSVWHRWNIRWCLLNNIENDNF